MGCRNSGLRTALFRFYPLDDFTDTRIGPEMSALQQFWESETFHARVSPLMPASDRCSRARPPEIFAGHTT